MATKSTKPVKSIEAAVKHVVQTTEKIVDAELEMLDNLKADDFEQIRASRLAAYRQKSKQISEWLKLGHGHYDEIQDEKDFFEVCKKSTHVVVHFYIEEKQSYKIFDYHFGILAPKHLETRFVKLNAAKTPFLTKRFNITFTPMILLVKENQCIDKIVGFSSLGNRSDFSTDMLKWRLAVSEMLKTTMDLTVPPDDKKKTVTRVRRTIRTGDTCDDSSDEL